MSLDNNRVSDSNHRTIDGVCHCIPYDDLVAYVEKNDLFLKEKEFYEIPVDSEIPMVGLDYLTFLAAEYSLKYNLEPDTIYDPTDFFDRFITIVKRHSDTEFGLESEFDGVKLKSANWRPEDDTKYMVTGSGDGYTRYIILPVAKQLPKFYFEIDQEAIEYQEDVQQSNKQKWELERNKFLQQGTKEEKKFVTEFPTYDAIKLQLPREHRDYYSMKHTVRQAIRYRNGVHLESFEEREARVAQWQGDGEYPMTDSEDEWDIQEKIQEKSRKKAKNQR